MYSWNLFFDNVLYVLILYDQEPSNSNDKYNTVPSKVDSYADYKTV